ncbi:MAG: hypothetical protein MUQ32_01775 [Chloroflexi bacterium]|nr:hypothetical protein [Chloroflexota bacterium]
MGFLRRMLGGAKADDDAGDSAGSPGKPGDAALDEVERDRELLRAEAHRLDNDLIQRQLRYADRAWTPPAQGGTRRAEDGDKPAG